METITAIIDRASDGGITVYAPKVPGVYAPAPTEAEAKAEFVEMLDEMADDIKERTGAYPRWYSPDGITVDYTYSLSGFFEAFPFINASALGQEIGINPSLMRRYKSGKSGVSKKQCAALQDAIGKIADRLHAVTF